LQRPVVTDDGCVDTVLTADTVGVVNGVVLKVVSVVTGAVVAVVVIGKVGVVSDSVVTAAGVVIYSVNHSYLCRICKIYEVSDIAVSQT